MCQYGDACTKGDQCTFIHMSDLKGKKEETSNGTVDSIPTNNTMIPCKFGLGCLKPDCPFGHPSAPTIALNRPLSSKSSIACKFDAGCLKPLCPYSHSSKTSAQATDMILPVPNTTFSGMSPVGINPVGKSPVAASPVQCKYDPFCTRAGCMFKHSPKDSSLAPSRKFSSEIQDESMNSPIIITSPNGLSEPATFSNGRPGRFKNKTLILNNSQHISQRGFAVSDSETEKFKMNVE